LVVLHKTQVSLLQTLSSEIWNEEHFVSDLEPIANINYTIGSPESPFRNIHVNKINFKTGLKKLHYKTHFESITSFETLNVTGATTGAVVYVNVGQDGYIKKAPLYMVITWDAIRMFNMVIKSPSGGLTGFSGKYLTGEESVGFGFVHDNSGYIQGYTRSSTGESYTSESYPILSRKFCTFSAFYIPNKYIQFAIIDQEAEYKNLGKLTTNLPDTSTSYLFTVSLTNATLYTGVTVQMVDILVDLT